MTLTLNSAARAQAQARLATSPVAVRIAAEKPRPQSVVEKAPALATAPSKPSLHSILRQFAEKWPGCFSPPDYAPMRALKIGIHRDIVDRLPDVKPRLIGSALHRYCRNPGYRRLLVAGATRFDLDGQPAGVVAEGDQATAPKVAVVAEREVPTQEQSKAA